MTEIGLKEWDLHLEPESLLGAWYAHVIYIDRRKCALFVNGTTLTSFLVAGVSREELRQLPVLFVKHWRQFLAYEGFPASVIETLLSEGARFDYAKAKDKSVLGSMSELARHYRWYFEDGRGTVDEAIHELNRMPMSPLKLDFPIEELKRRVSELAQKKA